MAENLDLLGDPIPENWGGRGRPAHLPTVENRNKVMLLLALGWEIVKIAAALGITQPTLRKHYFRELRVRVEARARLEAAMITGMAAKALGGDVPAFREVRKVIERAEMEEGGGAYQASGKALPAPKVEKLGKKAERQAAAEKIGGTFAPGAPPARLRH